MIPRVLTVENLARCGVLGAIVGSLFRVLQMRVGYSLLAAGSGCRLEARLWRQPGYQLILRARRTG